jgi:uncharacterized membrane protein
MWGNPDVFTTVLQVVYGIIHDLGIATYIGGAIAMEYVVGPAQNSIPPAQSQIMGQKTADRFLWLVWGSLGLIIVTGILRLDKLGHISLTSWPILGSDMSLGHDYGRTIWAMFALWCVLVANGLIMTFYLRPRLAGKLKAGTTTAGVQTSMQVKMEAAKWVGRLTKADILIAVVIALFGASLRFNGLL